MSKKNKIIVVILVVLAAGAAAVFFFLRTVEEKKDHLLKMLPDNVDMRIADFVYTEVGQDNVQWELQAKSAQYQKNRNLAQLEQVRVKLTVDKKREFILTGQQGEVDTDQKNFAVRGKVKIISDAGDTFVTDYLRYSGHEKKIYTDAPVAMENQRMKIQGRGLTILIEKEELALASNVRAIIR